MEKEITFLKGEKYTIYFKIKTVLWEQEDGFVEFYVGNNIVLMDGTLQYPKGAPIMRITTNVKENIASYITEIMLKLSDGKKIFETCSELPRANPIEFIDLEYWSTEGDWYPQKEIDRIRGPFKAFLNEAIMIVPDVCPLELSGKLPE